MEDIYEIYDPILRETNNILFIILIGLAVVLIGVALFFIIKRLRNKKTELTKEQIYQNSLNDFLGIQKNIDKIKTDEFSNKVSWLYRSYLSKLLTKDFLSLTTDELFSNIQNNSLYEIFKEKLEPAQFGKYDIDTDTKNKIIKECVDSITEQYNIKIGEDND